MAKFEKGHPGGPGRPRKTDDQIKFERQCREWAVLFALDKLKKAADSDNPTASLAATREILDRGFGKSVETSVIDAYVTPETGSTAQALEDELAAVLSEPAEKGAGNASQDQMDPGA